MSGSLMSDTYRVCTRCVMDTSDPDIKFDEDGVCSHCAYYDAHVAPQVESAQRGERWGVLEAKAARIREEGAGRPYDCILGLSGGVDSSYTAYLAKKLGLRPLAVHFDSGWNSSPAVRNIENIVKNLDLDLFTYVVDWEEMRDLQLTFFRASVANCDIPTDHAFPAVLNRKAASLGIRWILSGHNAETESILPRAWGHSSADLTYLEDVHKKHGGGRLKKYPRYGTFERYVWHPYARGIKTVRVLNYINYNKSEVKSIITSQLGWQDYGGKHHESVLTRFFQGFYLPLKFGFDKRRAHLSSLINSGQITRSAALMELELPTYPSELQASDKKYIAKKLGISESEMDAMIEAPPAPLDAFKSGMGLINLGVRAKRALRL